jgi:transcriptional regulator with XRE-family HTH domain
MSEEPQENEGNSPPKGKPAKYQKKYDSRGRPKHVPTEVFRKQILHFCGLGFTQEQISKLLNISEPTLTKYYRNELEIGSTQMNSIVINNLYHIATDPDHKSAAQAAIFWAKTRLGWRETNRTEHTGADGKPIQNEVSAKSTIDSRLLSPEQRTALREIMQSAAETQQRSLSNATTGQVYSNDDTEEDDDDEADE